MARTPAQQEKEKERRKRRRAELKAEKEAAAAAEAKQQRKPLTEPTPDEPAEPAEQAPSDPPKRQQKPSSAGPRPAEYDELREYALAKGNTEKAADLFAETNAGNPGYVVVNGEVTYSKEAADG